MSQENESCIKHKVFEMCRDEKTETLHPEKFYDELHARGIWKEDPRISSLVENIEKDSDGKVAKEKFEEIFDKHDNLMQKIFKQELVVPDFPTFCDEITKIYYKIKKIKSGANANYIPQLERINSSYWGVALCTVDGQRFAIGDSDVPFTIQSCCKPLMYAVALEHLTAATVHQYVGQEPSGRIFNDLVLDHNKKPHNPMINAGAIVTATLLATLVKPEMPISEKFAYVQSWFERACGNEKFGFNNSIFLSEREVADRNYALGFYMRENKVFPKDTNLRECLDFYFQICSMEATANTLSVVAATLANGGVCPITNEKVFKADVVRDVLSLMHSCGMYDYSGQFAFNVGLPGKSGVAGGVMLVIPNVAGIFTYSPPIDECGNSVKGINFAEELVKTFAFHPYQNLRHTVDKKHPRLSEEMQKK